MSEIKPDRIRIPLNGDDIVAAARAQGREPITLKNIHSLRDDSAIDAFMDDVMKRFSDTLDGLLKKPL